MAEPFVNVLAGAYIERAAHYRKEGDWLDAALAHTDSLFVPLWKSRNAVSKAGDSLASHFLTRDSNSFQSIVHRIEITRATFLGLKQGRACFAIKIDDDETVPSIDDAEFMDLRSMLDLLPHDDAGLLAYARALITWQDRHRYCGQCGAPTQLVSGGHTARCSNAECANEQFPRIDPAIIVLVTDGEHALLGRQAAWPAGRYSTVAGFVEPGESLEDAVIREVLEETGIEVDAVQYHSSQPWPFPQSLMLGFMAHARHTQIKLNDNELEDARWFTRDDIASGKVQCPPPISISGCLIESWYNMNAIRPLRDEPAIQNWTLRR
jgi:NAD+ diphosphatase